MTRHRALPRTGPSRGFSPRGLLVRIDDETVELPHRVGQAIRGDAPFDPGSLTPPRASKAVRALADVNATAAGAALELLRHCENLLSTLSRQPAPVLKAGGLGVRELHRLAKAVGIEDQHAALLVEVLAAAGLLARGIPDPPPPGISTTTGPPPRRPTAGSRPPRPTAGPFWRGAWLHMPRRPWLAGRRDQSDKPIAALSDEVKSTTAVRDRRLLLEFLADVPGSAPRPSQRSGPPRRGGRPRWAGRFDLDSVTETIREATALALVAHGSLSSAGKALLHGGDAEPEIAAALPEPSTTYSYRPT